MSTNEIQRASVRAGVEFAVGMMRMSSSAAVHEPLTQHLRTSRIVAAEPNRNTNESSTTINVVVISVPVDDQERALDFYTKKLGFVKKTDIPMGGPRWLTVVSPNQPDGPEVLLDPLDFPPTKTYQKAVYDAGIPVASFGVEDVAATHDRLKNLGVIFREPPTKMGTATVAVSEDTCGNLIQIAQDSKASSTGASEKEKTMEVTEEVVSKAEMIIRRPVAEVYQAFVDPGIVTKFWFDRSSGPLKRGKEVQWYWDRFDLTVDAKVDALEENERILVELSTKTHKPTMVEWKFAPRSSDTTHVLITHKGFAGNGNEIVNAALDSAGGFALVLAAAKAYLEHNVNLNIVADKP